jgi:hypothetical protein
VLRRRPGCASKASAHLRRGPGNVVETHEHARRKDFRFQDIDLNDTLEFTKQLPTLYAQWLKK